MQPTEPPPLSSPVAVDPAMVDVAQLPAGSPHPFTWHALFGNDRPVELEIGTGKAAFLLRRARAVPEHNFLGIEWANQFYRYAVDRFERWRVPNVKMLRADASVFVRRVCPRGSLTALHIFHPDPWPKKRHHKRRLFQPAFVDAACECLKPGGRLAIQTDHAEYFEWIMALLANERRLAPADFHAPAWRAGFLPPGETESDEADNDGELPALLGTNFELKYRREGRAIHSVAFTRV
jgi:tRNA (guanine-N7-)-methyltransferase